jgi:hypothetical protein
MRIRIALAAALLGLSAACSNATDPLMACDGNPKCKADNSPKPPSRLPLQSSPSIVDAR